MPAEPNISSKRTTIYDIANLAGTSASAVSAVLNGSWKKRRISAQTAERVSRIAEEQGYSVNIQASMLRRERSKIVGMIVPKYDNRYFGEMAERFEERARARGLFPVITCTQRDPDLEIAAAKELLAYQVGGLVVSGATDPDHISELCKAAGVRTVNLDLPGSKAPSVISDNTAGARALTKRLLDTTSDLGALLFIGGRASDHNTAARIKGFRDAHVQRGIALTQDHVIACGYAPQKARSALEQRDMTDIAGLFVNSTITLEGVVGWLNSLPEQHRARLRFGCFDWDPFAALLPGNIGMVRQDIAAMLDKVFELLDIDSAETGLTLVDCQIVPLQQLRK